MAASQALIVRGVTPASLGSLQRSDVSNASSSRAGAPKLASQAAPSMLAVRASARPEQVAKESRAGPMKAAAVAIVSALALNQAPLSPALAAEMYEGRSDLPDIVLKEGLPPGRPSPLSGPTDLTKNANEARKNSAKTFDRIFGRAKDTASNVQDTAEKGKAVATSKAPTVFGKAKGKVDNTVGNLPDKAASGAKSGAGGVLDDLKQTVGDVVGNF